MALTSNQYIKFTTPSGVVLGVLENGVYRVATGAEAVKIALGQVPVQTLQAKTDTPINEFNKVATPTQTKDTTDERKSALAEAQSYYGYSLPTGQSAYGYPQQEADISQQSNIARQNTEQDYQFKLEQLTAQKSQLLQDYTNYLEDIKAGRLRVGEDRQMQLAKLLADKKNYLDQQELSVKQGIEQTNRSFIARGGLFSGVRAQAVGEYQQQANLQQQAYLNNYDYNTQKLETGYDRAMQDYLTAEGRAGQTYQENVSSTQKQASYYDQLKDRSLTQIALEELQRKRQLQEMFQQAIGQRVAQTLQEQYTQ